MRKESIQAGLIGLGTIGTGTARILLDNAGNLAKRAGAPVILKRAVDLDASRNAGLEGVLFSTEARDILGDPEIGIVIELIGGVHPAREFILEALSGKKHVVTANKEVIAKHGPELLEAARQNGVNLYYEAAVCGGIPILHALKNCLAANNVQKVCGILNGTTNYILTQMSREGAEFGQALREAQERGYAEADPTADVDGYDATYKLAILASIAFNTHFNYEDIYREGIRHLSAADIKLAEELGCVIKLLAVGIERGGQAELRVHPVMLDRSHPLANVSGTFNAVLVEGNYLGEAMFYGHGAGQLPTASAVAGDVLNIAMHRDMAKSHPSMTTRFQEKKVLPMGEVECEYFLRMRVKDQPGVLAAISKICADRRVSIKSVRQKDASGGEAEIVIITHTVKEAAMQAAVTEIKELDVVLQFHSLIRAGL